MYEYKAKLDWSGSRHPVYDGDSVRLIVDLGFGATLALGMCRLYGINTPELRGKDKEAGKAARDYLRELLPERDWFVVETHKDGKGKYGRYLVDIFIVNIDKETTHVNDRMITDGHAKAYYP